ncbi:hypothetical protein BGZ61DRAFT_460016 [Ilyonectria robusta]|uniref:uncharacterized protein n=1 Tax=Ilyonectria robusta TaxID=1079257 RepID=UPI001E8EB534|nr:uncharacterized protein BGZ61DRAFT_460016 [Ilyonectria robusta]KAH8669830.1 hypothetical protein BGZ61DRAFT_460016 [Ilyonectria robusta]
MPAGSATRWSVLRQLILAGCAGRPHTQTPLTFLSLSLSLSLRQLGCAPGRDEVSASLNASARDCLITAGPPGLSKSHSHHDPL